MKPSAARPLHDRSIHAGRDKPHIRLARGRYWCFTREVNNAPVTDPARMFRIGVGSGFRAAYAQWSIIGPHRATRTHLELTA